MLQKYTKLKILKKALKMQIYQRMQRYAKLNLASLGYETNIGIK